MKVFLDFIWICRGLHSYLFCRSLLAFLLPFLPPIPRKPVIDLKAFGVDGIMPRQLTTMRDIIKDKDPAVWELVHQNDPIMERILSDPKAARKMVQETLESLREAEAAAA